MEYDVVVVGGGAGGIAVSLAVKSIYPDKKVLVIRRTKKQPIPCGVPYIVETIGSVEKNIIPDTIYEANGIDLVIDEAIEIDRDQKKVKTRKGDSYSYDKLVIATGAGPVRLNIPGIDLENVILVHKEYEPLLEIFPRLRDAKKIVIIGAGFVGMEFADDLAKSREIHIVEILDEALPLSFDREFGEQARRELELRGVKFHLKTSVAEIKGDGKVGKVVLSNGEGIPADAVLVSVGVAPNSELARRAGLRLDERGHIIVDEFMRTSDPDIYAVGDVIQKKCFFTGKPIKAYFSSLAVIEAKIAALNMFKKASLGFSDGVLPVYSTVIGNIAFAAAGMTENMAKKNNLDVTPIIVETINRHPGCLPRATKIRLKGLFMRKNLRLIGVQISGPECVGELINYAASIIQMKLTAYDMIKLQVATQPKLTPSPISYPLYEAALRAIGEE